MQSCTAVIEHGAYLSVDVADHEVVAGVERAVLYEHGGHGSAAAVEFGFQHHAGCAALRSSFQLGEVCDQANHFQEQIQIGFLFRGNIDEHRFAAPVFGHEAAIGQLLFDAVGHGFRLVDFVDRNDDGDFGGVRVIDGFEGLRHHAVVSGHDQHNNIGRLGAARAHASESLVTGSVEENDLAAEGGRFFVGDANFVCADVLGDASGFTFGHAGQANGVEQSGFAVIDMSHDRDHGRPRYGSDRGFFSAAGGGLDI